MARSSFLIPVLAIAAGSCSAALAKDNYPSGLYKVLRAAGFQFQDKNSRRRLAPEGPILVGGKQYQIWSFVWEDRRRVNPDKTPYWHESLVVLEQTKAGQFYVGSYEVGNVTYHICGKAICFTSGESEADRDFGYKPLADKVAFDQMGPPSRAHINGADRIFDRKDVPFAVGWDEPDYYSGTWKVLLDADPDLPVNSDTRIEQVGSISGPSQDYEIWRYAWEETAQTKKANTEHAGYKLLVFERAARGLSFIGDYKVDGVPVRIQGRSAKFDYGRDVPSAGAGSSEIVFGKNGPPAHVLLNGEIRTFDPAAHHKGVWRVLEQGGFGGDTGIEARMSRVGMIGAAGKHYEIWSYSWKGRAGNGPLESRKVLVFEKDQKELTYLGSYDRDDVAFHVEGQTIKFDLPKAGKPKEILSDDPGPGIEFGDRGPPAQARVNWQTRTFGK